MSLHIAGNKNVKLAETVLMPGDPLRAEFIAKNFLDNAEKYTDIRNMYGFNGTYKGVPVTVQGSGMGIPSMGIYSWELFNEFDVQNIIRIGTAGSFDPTIHVGDVVMGMTASTDSNYADMFNLNGNFAPSCSFKLLQKAVGAAENIDKTIHAGSILTSDHFYEAQEDWWKPWQKMGIKAVEMETAGLYSNAAYFGRNALAILTISDHFVLDEDASVEERQNSFTDMMEIALETAVTL